MQKMNRSWAKVLFTILSVLTLIAAVSFAEQEGTIDAQITGKITNLQKAEKYLLEDPHLLLLHSEDNISMSISANGNFLIIPPDGRKCSISKSGEFTLDATQLKAGNYMMFVQPISGFTLSIGGNAFSTSFIAKEKEKKMMDVTIPEQTPGKPVTLDLGKVWIGIP